MCIEVTNGSFIRGNGWSRSTNNKTGNQFGLKTDNIESKITENT
jgi:hypothetical protein